MVLLNGIFTYALTIISFTCASVKKEAFIQILDRKKEFFAIGLLLL